MTADIVGDRVQLPLAFDVDGLQRDLRALSLRAGFVYYDVAMLTVPTPLTGVAEPNYADGSWATWSDGPWLRESPAMLEVVDTFRAHTTVTLVRLLRLAPGAVVDEHVDPTIGLEVADSIIRLHVPVVTHADVEFRLNCTRVEMSPGECWYLRFTDPHSITNRSEIVRTHLSLDMIPNDWVRSMITAADQ